MCLFLIGPAPDPPVFVCRRATIDFVLLLLFIYFSSLLIYIVFVIIWLLAAFCCTLYASRVGPASSPLVFVCEGTGVYCPVVQGVRGMGILGHNQGTLCSPGIHLFYGKCFFFRSRGSFLGFHDTASV